MEKSQTNATNVTLHPLGQAIWGHIWKHTVEKSQTNVTNATMPLLMQVIWGSTWTVEKSQTNANSVTFCPLRQAIWGDIWRRTLGKAKQTQPVTMHPLRQGCRICCSAADRHFFILPDTFIFGLILWSNAGHFYFWSNVAIYAHCVAFQLNFVVKFYVISAIYAILAEF